MIQPSPQRPVLRYRRWLLPALAFLGLSAGITAAASVHLRGFERQLRAHVERELGTIADLKVQQIVEWREAALTDATELGFGPTQDVLLRAIDAGATADDRAEALRRMQVRVTRLSLERGAVVDGQGRPWLATDTHGSQTEERDLHVLQRAIASGRPAIVDQGSAGGAIRIIVPLHAPGREPLAVILSGSVGSSLPSSVRAWPIPSQSAEAFLAAVHGEDVVILDALRFMGGRPYPPAFKLEGTQFPLALAARGEVGTGRHLDHRGNPVLAAWRRIPDSSWVMSVKVNEDELLAPAQERARSLSLAVAAILLAAGAALAFWWRSEREALNRRERDLQDRERVERLQYMWKHGYDVVVIADDAGRIVDANDRAAELYGYDRDELIGMPVAELRTDAERPGLEALWERLRSEPGGLLTETHHRRRDGTSVPVEAGLRLVQSDQRVFLYCIIRDITDRRSAEQEARRQDDRLRAAQAQLAFSDRLASIGTLAAGVAHEINNPLAYVMSNLEFLQDTIRSCQGAPAPPAATQVAELDAAVEESREGIRRISEIVRTLRTFSRRDRAQGSPVPIDLRDPVRAALRIASSEIRTRAKLVLELDGEPIVAAPEHELAQIAVNLLVNAAQAIPDGHQTEHTVTVRTRTGDRWAILEVEDTGAGIPPEMLGRIFDPFFTTKPVGEGTGLGLSVCLGIVEGLGGRIEVDSRPGQGCVFRVLIPRAHGSGAEHVAPPGAPVEHAAAGPRRRILVIDDDPLVGRVVTQPLVVPGDPVDA